MGAKIKISQPASVLTSLLMQPGLSRKHNARVGSHFVRPEACPVELVIVLQRLRTHMNGFMSRAFPKYYCTILTVSTGPFISCLGPDRNAKGGTEICKALLFTSMIACRPCTFASHPNESGHVPTTNKLDWEVLYQRAF